MFDFDVLKISEATDGEPTADQILAGEFLSGPETVAARPAGAIGLRLDVRVTDIPRAPALTLAPGAGVATAIAAMRERARSAAVVVENHRPVGVVTDREILTRASADLDDLRAIPLADVMLPCPEPLRENDTVGAALRRMCAGRRWHLPIVCQRGLFLGALDIADISFWLRDRLTLISVDEALGGVEASL
jgi:CBS domain-containing protein